MLENEINKRYIELNKIIEVEKEDVETGITLHRESIVCDSLSRDPEIISENTLKSIIEMLDAEKSLQEINIMIQKNRKYELMNNVITQREYIDYWNKSGVTCISSTLPSKDMQSLLEAMANDNYKIEKLDILSRATCTYDIKQAKKEGKHTILWNLQNSLLIEPRNLGLDAIDLLHGLGVRILQLTYNLRNYVGDGCMERNDGGLSIFGLKTVEKMNEIGMLIDVSHCSYKTTMDAIETSRDPIAFTHTGCRAVFDHPRNKTDEQIKALSEKGGYIGIYGIPYFLGNPAREKGNLKGLLDHIEHAIEIAGISHVGIGLDTGVQSRHPERLALLITQELFKKEFKPPIFWEGWKLEHGVDERMDPIPDHWTHSWVNWPNITIGLVSRGYSEEEIKGIIGNNFLDILKKVVD